MSFASSASCDRIIIPCNTRSATTLKPQASKLNSDHPGAKQCLASKL